ncbi:MAG: hypothetical protein JRI67_12065, partial [Deltaproteobacteria bacterium]|nr:hypothetical protein [Deltaproteobacteria bacterium]
LPPQNLRQMARDSKRVHSPHRDAELQAIPERVLLVVVVVVVYDDAHNLINKKRGKKQEKRH